MIRSKNPRRLQGVRQPAVAGRFYPASPAALRKQADQLIRQAGSAIEPPRGDVKAIIAPHAGFPYSGPIAGSAFASLREATGVERVVIIGPSHYEAFAGVALPAAAAFDVPGGRLPVDVDAAAALLELDGVAFHPPAHDREHAIEVELPFVFHLWGEVRIVPLVVGEASPEEVARVLEVVWGGPETRIVVSSDLSHFLPYAQAQAADAATAAIIESLEGRLTGEQACGARAVAGMMRVARDRGFAVTRLDLRNSGDIAKDRDAVVGYGAWAFSDQPESEQGACTMREVVRKANPS